MILFKKYYKAANDDIKPNRELIDKIFVDAQVQAAPKKAAVKFRFGYGTAAAALLIVAISVFVYPQISKTSEEPQIASTNHTETENAEINPAKASDIQKTPENTANVAPEKSNVNENSSVRNTTQNPGTVNPENTASEQVTPQGRIMEVQPYMEEEEHQYEVLLSELQPVGEEEAALADEKLIEHFGEKDTETGNLYIFEIAGILKANDKDYYLGRWRWIVDGHSSLLCEFVLCTDFTEMYECSYGEAGEIKWTRDQNLIK